MASYRPGGKHPGVSVHKYEDGKGDTVNVTNSGAGMGTTDNQPNVKAGTMPGGTGSTGTASDSSEK